MKKRLGLCAFVFLLGFGVSLQANEVTLNPIPDHCKNVGVEEELELEDLKECFRSYKQAFEILNPEQELGENNHYEPQMRSVGYEPQMRPTNKSAYEPQMKPTNKVSYEPQMRPAGYEPQMYKK